MNRYTVIALLLLTMIISCKKKTVLPLESNKEPEIEIVKIEKPIFIDSTFIKNHYPRTFEFYKSNNFSSVWHNKSNRDSYFLFLKNIDEDGLDPKDYWYTAIKNKLNNYDSLNNQEISDLDALLSKSFLKLANNIYSGKLNPKSLYTDWDMDPKEINTEVVLARALANNKINFVLDSLRPDNKIYYKLRNELKNYKEIDNDSSYIENIRITSNKKIVVNDTNDVVYDIKKRLVYLNLYQKDSITNVYDEDLQEIIKKFQKTHNLTPDGTIGLNTIKALNKNKDYRKKQIIANLERLRWFPKNLGDNYVMVNIPEYRLWFISNQDTVISKKVIVGRNSRKTPILSSKFSDIVFNPTWTVPPTILKKDLTPAAQKDSNYFHRNKIKIYHAGQLVSPSNWNSENASSYRYVQDPGKHNSLGIIKFNFPNSHSVYLHDTNHKNAFGQDTRDLSSGCIRVSEPLELASKIFEIDENNSMTINKMNNIIAKGNTNSIKIKNPIYIHQFYWTVSLDKDGNIKYNDDIYDLDIPLYNALQI